MPNIWEKTRRQKGNPNTLQRQGALQGAEAGSSAAGTSRGDLTAQGGNGPRAESGRWDEPEVLPRWGWGPSGRCGGSVGWQRGRGPAGAKAQESDETMLAGGQQTSWNFDVLFPLGYVYSTEVRIKSNNIRVNKFSAYFKS